MDRLNKGTFIQNGYDLMSEGLRRGAGISCLWIDRLPFMTEDMAEESVIMVKKIRDLVFSNSDYKNRFYFFTNKFLALPTEEKAAVYGEYISLGSVVGGFLNVLSPEQEYLNRRVRDAVYSSGVRVFGT
jgi:hypothetical protein